MRKFTFALCIAGASTLSAQFKVTANLPSTFNVQDAYLFGYDGSKDILLAKTSAKNNVVTFSNPKAYSGALRVVFFPSNASVQMAAENKDINFVVKTVDKNNIKEVTFNDEVNKVFLEGQTSQKKKELIYPALLQIKEYYKPTDAFYPALESEIKSLAATNGATKDYPFINYFHDVSSKYVNNPNYKTIPVQDYIDFLSNTNQYLETSSLLKPILISFLNTAGKDSLNKDIESLLKAVNIETPRGQTILSELIDIFDTYGMADLKDKYFNEAKALKCTINDRLNTTIKNIDEVQVGSTFKNATLYNAYNTKAKTLYDIKADHKVVVFWSSTCSHCVTELPKFIEKYTAMKAKKIEIIGLSLDASLQSYGDMASKFPWISASEGKAWYSDYAKDYNVHATPTYFVLDSSNKIVAKPDNLTEVFNYLGIK